MRGALHYTAVFLLWAASASATVPPAFSKDYGWLNADHAESSDGSVEIEGTAPQGSRWVIIEAVRKYQIGHPENTTTWLLPVSVDGRFRQVVTFRNGPGVYLIQAGNLLKPFWGGPAEVFRHLYFRSRSARDDPYSLPSQRVPSDDPDIAALGQKIAEQNPDRLARARAIHEWVTRNIAFDLPHLRNGNFPLPDGATTFRNRQAVCEGYATVSAALHRAAGIAAKVVHGATIRLTAGEVWTPEHRRTAHHAWIEAWIDDRWVAEDPTWDAGYTDRRVHVWKPLASMRYFDPPADVFDRDHLKIRESGD